ncbi:hypothetical protein PFISCL1PPCAC_4399, partial [Pristionchus fissidentatus]
PLGRPDSTDPTIRIDTAREFAVQLANDCDANSAHGGSHGDADLEKHTVVKTEEPEDTVDVESIDEPMDTVPGAALDGLQDTVPAAADVADKDTMPPLLVREDIALGRTQLRIERALDEHIPTVSKSPSATVAVPVIVPVRRAYDDRVKQVLGRLQKRLELGLFPPKAKRKKQPARCHIVQQRFECDNCDFFARTEQKLAQHRNSMCHRCRATVPSCAMAGHWQEHFENFRAALPDTPDTRYPPGLCCPFCPRVQFGCLSEVHHHMESTHKTLLEDEAPLIFCCLQCSIAFPTLPALSDHWKHRGCDLWLSFDQTAAEAAINSAAARAAALDAAAAAGASVQYHQLR